MCMNYFLKLFFILTLILCISCNRNSETKIYHSKRENIVNVREKVKEIKINEDDVLIGSVARLTLLDNYLIIHDNRSLDKLIRIFDKNNFNYLTSVGERGQGPNEITIMGFIGTNDKDRIFYVSDHGKQRILAFSLDSVLINPSYFPVVNVEMKQSQFPSNYQYISDSLSIGVIIEPIGNNDFDQSVAKWNMNTGEITPFPYRHPDIKKKRIAFAVSMENDIYVECYLNHDLMTICNFNGELKYVIYGPEWSEKNTNLHYFGKVVFCGDNMLAAYSGGNWQTEYEPTKFMVFDLSGNYIKTLETGYKIPDYCYDKANNRIIMNIDDIDLQFAYLDLDGLVE